jgi:L-alanine-DL-glutamate epimerase-like enolase superfamily enzyme
MGTTIERIECWVLRAPVARPVRAAMGTMTTRPALFVRVAAADGAHGWGEVWCNFPPPGAEHRARLLRAIFAPLVVGLDAARPERVRAALEAKTRTLAIQCGEPGPFAQIVAGIDQACWDLAARRAGVPLWKHLGGTSDRVRVYASGLGPDDVVETALARRTEGYRAFKLKVGMDAERDRANLAALRDALGAEATIMVDANQAWSPAEALERIAGLAPLRPHWVEEPIAADEPGDAWSLIAERAGIPLAAGENLRGEGAFDAAIAGGYLRYLQPDVGKWGGISGCRDVAARAVERGLAVCPHWLAGGLGLAASMHLLAAAGGGGYAEVDANPNPLREAVFPFLVADGWANLPDAPGLGVEPDLARLAPYLVAS